MKEIPLGNGLRTDDGSLPAISVAGRRLSRY
jgi:hypothetical protein